MEADLFIQNNLVIPGYELKVTASRSGGPGGQNVQKTNTRVTLRFNIMESTVLTDTQKQRLFLQLSSKLTAESEIVIHVDTERSQWQNRRIARERLAEIIHNGLKVVRKRVATKPTRASKERRIAEKKRIGQTKSQREKPSF